MILAQSSFQVLIYVVNVLTLLGTRTQTSITITKTQDELLCGIKVIFL